MRLSPELGAIAYRKRRSFSNVLPGSLLEICTTVRAVPLRTRLDMWWHLSRRNAIRPAASLLGSPDRIQTLPRYLLLRSPEGSSISYTLGRDCYVGFCARRLYPFEGLLCDVSARRNACLDDFGALWEESPALPIQWEITASATTATIGQNKADNLQPTGLRSDDCIGICRKCSGDFSRPRDPPLWPWSGCRHHRIHYRCPHCIVGLAPSGGIAEHRPGG